MDYSERQDVTESTCDAPTRVIHTGSAAVTRRPKTRAANLEQVSWIVAISQDPFAFVHRTFAPLAGRNCPAPLIPAVSRYYPKHPMSSLLSVMGSPARRCLFQR